MFMPQLTALIKQVTNGGRLWHSGRARENGRWLCGDATSQGYSRRSVGVTFAASVIR
jgi:hypothetical protein